MKRINILLFKLILISFVVSCDFIELDKEPLDMLSDVAVFSDQNLVESNLAQIYHLTLFHYGNIDEPVWALLESGMGAEARGFALWQVCSSFPLEVIDEGGAGPIDYWPYRNIRNANEFIEKLPNTDFDQDWIEQKVAEARYLRAHMYFQMVKRFGGVPLITEAQDPDSPEGELFVARDSEQDIYDFIAVEMDDIASFLPENADAGRVNKYTALALKSRAMLYAASVAEFGTVQMNGLLGIPAGQAESYWQASYDASMDIVNSDKYSLFNNIDDPAENFQHLFVADSDNPERIFVEVYDPGMDKGHSWNLGAVPFEMRDTWGSNYCPFLHVIEQFEYADGTPGTIDRDLIESDHLFDIDEVFRNRDPRFLATFFFPESEWQGGQVRFHSRTIYNDETLTSGTIEDTWPAAAPRRNFINTGFLLRKRMDESEVGPARGTSKTDYMIFRYGEILLNLAEAAYYLNKTGESLDMINMIRERAGMPLRTTVSEDDIRNERAVELAFEDHRYWDLRRWRIAHEFLHEFQTEGLEYTYNFNEDKYNFHLKVGDPRARTFQERHYYLPLGVNRIADNPMLDENPGY